MNVAEMCYYYGLAVSYISLKQGFTHLTALFVVKSNHHDMQHRPFGFVSAVRLHYTQVLDCPVLCSGVKRADGSSWIEAVRSRRTGGQQRNTTSAQMSFSSASPHSRSCLQSGMVLRSALPCLLAKRSQLGRLKLHS